MSKRASGKVSLEHLAIHLLHRAAQRADESFDEQVKHADLTPRQLAVLVSVAQAEGQSQTDIVNRTGIDRSTTADMIRRLVRKGLLLRRRQKEDARAYALRLTDAGHEALAATESGVLRADAQVLSVLTAEQRKGFIEVLKLVASSRRKPA